MDTIIGMIPNHPMVFPLLFAILVLLILMFIPFVVLVYSKNNKNYKLFVILSLIVVCYGYFLYEIRDYAFKHPTTSARSTTHSGNYKDIRCESEFCNIRHIEILTVYPFGYGSKFSEEYIIEQEL